MAHRAYCRYFKILELFISDWWLLKTPSPSQALWLPNTKEGEFSSTIVIVLSDAHQQTVSDLGSPPNTWCGPEFRSICGLKDDKYHQDNLIGSKHMTVFIVFIVFLNAFICSYWLGFNPVIVICLESALAEQGGIGIHYINNASPNKGELHN